MEPGRSSRNYWNSEARLVVSGRAAQFADKYVVVPADSPLRKRPVELVDLANVRKLGDAMEESVRRPDAVVNGRRMIVLTQPDESLGTATLYFPTEGPPLPIRVEATDAKGDGVTLDWLDFDRPVDIRRPAAELVLDLTGQRARS
ncbi:hypothetical protein ACIRL2_35700 [Embleya sp. NPDC127516]|uniref:hypothetical protein n=1 Tax=Embleya sp. NPDC127516 TaxID=3363990 RepID=UPI0038202684